MERKKGFMEDGGGFDRIWDGTVELLRRFKGTAYARALAVLLVIAFVFCFMTEYNLRNFANHLYNRFSQSEADVLETGEDSAAEIGIVCDDLRWMISGYLTEHNFRDHEEELGYSIYTDQEKQFILESSALFDKLDDLTQSLDIWSSVLGPLAWSLLLWLSAEKGKRWGMFVVLGGLAVAFLPIAFFAACFARDYAGTVETICGALYTADCWRLSPETSIIARLMPENAFKGMGLELLNEALQVAAVLIAILFAIESVFLIIHHFRHKKQEKEESK